MAGEDSFNRYVIPKLPITAVTGLYVANGEMFFFTRIRLKEFLLKGV